MDKQAPLLRSALYMPGSNTRALAKARELPADAVILDLEDAVAPDAKAEARAAVAGELQNGGFGPRFRVVRVNALQSEWGVADLAALADAPVDAVLVPKVDSAETVQQVAARMRELGYAEEVGLWAMIETPAAILKLAAIGACAADTPLAGFVLGLNDLAKDTGMAQTSGRTAMQPVLTMSVITARANGLVVLDGVCNALDDAERLTAECVQAREFGFDGKTLIHPRQIATANEIFAPDAEQIAEAQAIVAAFAHPANAAKGALQVNGKMVERLHLSQAKALLQKAEAVSVRNRS